MSSSRHTTRSPIKRENPPLPAPKRRKRVKSTTGCFTCRKRKKKCDEAFPVCSGCSRNYLDCVWPSRTDECVPRGFAVRPAQTYSLNKPADLGIPENMFAIADFGVVVHDLAREPEPFRELVFKAEDFSQVDTLDSVDDSDSEYYPASPASLESSSTSVSVFSDLELSSQFSGSSWIPNVHLSEEDAFLYHAFLTSFIPSVSPTHSHPGLSPANVFIPEGSVSEVLREIFFACGAYIIAYKDSDKTDMAMRRYTKSIQSFRKVISSGEIMGNEDWLLVAVQSLCLRDRAVGLGASRCVNHVIAAFNLLQQKLKVAELETSPRLRTLLDSFVFNYSIVIYLCDYDQLTKLPSPFLFFDLYRGFLQGSVYHDELSESIPWLNNPVMGSSFVCFEIASKLFWLLRMRLEGDVLTSGIDDAEYVSMLTQLRFDLDAATKRIDLYEVQLNDILERYGRLPRHFPKPEYLTVNICLSKIMIYTLEILYMKICNHSLAAEDAKIQAYIDLIFNTYTVEIPEYDHSACLSLWAMFIAGTASVKTVHQRFFINCLRETSRILYSDSANKLAQALENLWANESQFGVRAFDVIISREGLSGLAF